MVEKKSYIGGKTILLSKILPLCGRCLLRYQSYDKSKKIFADNDCTFCIIEPKLNELISSEKINLLEYSEVIGLEGNEGNFKVKVLRKSKFVDADKCIGCGDCVNVCPVENKINFEKRKAIYLPIYQTYPKTATIDKEKCLYLRFGKCGKCKDVCVARAIDFEIKNKVVELNVSAIILAIGFDIYNPSDLIEYGYNKYQNVYTAMEFERLTSKSGQTKGKLIIPPNNKNPKKIAFIQCVGARDLKRNPYCCSVCCVHATKQALVASELYSQIKTYIFYTDLRVCEKDFYDYVKIGEEEYNIKYIRAKPGEILEDKESKKLTIFYDDKKIVKSLVVDMVVLSTALVPAKDAKKLAEILGIKLDKNEFFKIKDKLESPVDTTKKGIFVAGFCESPKDIPESVLQGSATAKRATEFISGLQ